MADDLQRRFAAYKKRKAKEMKSRRPVRHGGTDRSRKALDDLRHEVRERKRPFLARMFGRKEAPKAAAPAPPEKGKARAEAPGKPERPRKQARAGLFAKIKEKKEYERLKTEIERKAKTKAKDPDVTVTAFRIKRKRHRRKLTASEKRRRLKTYLEKAGYDVNEQQAYKSIFRLSILLGFVATGIFIYKQVGLEQSIWYVLTTVLIIWSFGFLLILLSLWVVFYVIIDFQIVKRRFELEEVLPDYLQLTSANIRAGMPIDRALWFAVRPRFGVLAREIEDVAKQTLSGVELKDALLNFTMRYDSTVLKRSVSLLVEGLDAGGEIGDLLNKISLDIQETRIMKKEMAANVTTYVIFITFASIIAAPFLFGLSYTLLSIIQGITSNIDTSSLSGGMGFALTSDAVSLADFRFFAITTLTVTSFFSSAIVATIKKGNIVEGVRYIPVFITTAIVLFLIAVRLLGAMMGNMLQF
ncbi:type II secretion system F family protein [Candidatus Woesearchaeota archaeon]|nr:type II secretion system F family protein [Candidatus Woesearchaeota archaeon]